MKVMLAILLGIMLPLGATPPVKAKPKAAKAATVQITDKMIVKEIRKMFSEVEPYSTDETIALQGYAEDPEEAIKFLLNLLVTRYHQEEHNMYQWIDLKLTLVHSGDKVGAAQCEEQINASTARQEHYVATFKLYKELTPDIVKERLTHPQP